MPIGKGVYDDECTKLREATGARLAVVIVIGGNRGNGFSGQIRGDSPIDQRVLAAILRSMADDLDSSRN